MQTALSIIAGVGGAMTGILVWRNNRGRRDGESAGNFLRYLLCAFLVMNGIALILASFEHPALQIPTLLAFGDAGLFLCIFVIVLVFRHVRQNRTEGK